MTATQLRANLYKTLEKALQTGEPVDIEYQGRRLKLVPERKVFNIANLRPHPGAIVGDPDDLVHIDWSSDWNYDFP